MRLLRNGVYCGMNNATFKDCRFFQEPDGRFSRNDQMIYIKEKREDGSRDFHVHFDFVLLRNYLNLHLQENGSGKMRESA